MNDKVLSIVIPCYNEKDNIVNLVQKVLESPIKNKEIIIVDDMSKDGTREILKKQTVDSCQTLSQQNYLSQKKWRERSCFENRI